MSLSALDFLSHFHVESFRRFNTFLLRGLQKRIQDWLNPDRWPFESILWHGSNYPGTNPNVCQDESIPLNLWLASVSLCRVSHGLRWLRSSFEGQLDENLYRDFCENSGMGSSCLQNHLPLCCRQCMFNFRTRYSLTRTELQRFPKRPSPWGLFAKSL